MQRILVGAGAGLMTGPLGSALGMSTISGVLFTLGLVLTILSTVDLIKGNDV